MKGTQKWLWEVFAIIMVAYCLYRSPRFVLLAAVIVFVGGGILLSVFGYAAAKYSMPRPAMFWLQLYYPESITTEQHMSPLRRFFWRLIFGWKPKT